MKLKLKIVSGPHRGKEFEFDGRDTFLVGRTKEAHFQLSYDDPYFSRRHFVLEFNPPRCRLINLSKRNGTLLNGFRVEWAEVEHGDEIGAGHTVFKLQISPSEQSERETLDMPSPTKRLDPTLEYESTSVAVPGYRIGPEIGRGAMGVVYRGTAERDGASVAIKTICPAPGTSRKQIERFVRESTILSKLKHDNIVAFQEVGEAGSMLYLVMELVEGPNLADRLKEKGPEDFRTAIRIVCHMLKGLAHAHASGFVHRDIKPSNVLIGFAGANRIAKLADFGLARVYESAHISGLTMQGEVGGTPAFMAPEQVTHYRDVKPAADQYSAAATLYKLLTDRYTRDLPKDVGAQLAHIVTSEPIPISERRPDIPTKLAAVIHKALNRDPSARYPDVLAFRQELKRFA